MAKNKNKGFRLDDMPQEVYWAKFIGAHWDGREFIQMVGTDQYNKIRQIQKKYPEWFPWETKYDEIPEEVHEAYKREAYPYLYEAIDVGALTKDKNDSTPVKPWTDTYDGLTLETLNQFMDEMYNRMEEQERKRKEEKAKAKKLWDKHYKKYGLEYRG